MAKKQKMGEIVEINHETKVMKVRGDLTDPQFVALIQLNNPGGYKIEFAERELSDKQKAVIEENRKRNGEWFKDNLEPAEYKVWEAIKETKNYTLNGETKKCGFAQAKKWFDDGKMLYDGKPKLAIWDKNSKAKKAVGYYVLETGTGIATMLDK